MENKSYPFHCATQQVPCVCKDTGPSFGCTNINPGEPTVSHYLPPASSLSTIHDLLQLSYESCSMHTIMVLQLKSKASFWLTPFQCFVLTPGSLDSIPSFRTQPILVDVSKHTYKVQKHPDLRLLLTVTGCPAAFQCKKTRTSILSWF